MIHTQSPYEARIASILQELRISPEYGAKRQLQIQKEPVVSQLREIGKGLVGQPLLLTFSAASAWKEMREAAREEGIVLTPVSAFRDVEYQKNIVRRKLENGQSLEEILKVSAAPGYSEHHTACALDITTDGVEPFTEKFEDTTAFNWLVKNAERFGFVLSYPKNNPHGIAYEPWHWCFKPEQCPTYLESQMFPKGAWPDTHGNWHLPRGSAQTYLPEHATHRRHFGTVTELQSTLFPVEAVESGNILKNDGSKMKVGTVDPQYGLDRLPPESFNVHLAKSVVNFLWEHGHCRALAEHQIDNFRDFILRWSKPFRYSWLVSRFNNDEEGDDKIDAIVKGQLCLQANSEEELIRVRLEHDKRIRHPESQVDLSYRPDVSTDGHFANLRAVRAIVKAGCMMPLPLTIPVEANIRLKLGDYVHPELAFQLEMHFGNDRLPAYGGILRKSVRVCSGTRDILTQSLLRELGYPAAILSHHTKGQAVDFRLIPEAKARWNNYLNEKILLDVTSNQFVSRLDKINDLADKGIEPTIDTLLVYGVIEADSEIARIHTVFSTLPAKLILDESSYFITRSTNGRITSINPLWHIQLSNIDQERSLLFGSSATGDIGRMNSFERWHDDGITAVLAKTG